MGKDKANASSFADDTLHKAAPKYSAKNPLPLINTFSRGAGYKINLLSLVAFLCTKDKQTQTEREIRKAISFTIEKQNKTS